MFVRILYNCLQTFAFPVILPRIRTHRAAKLARPLLSRGAPAPASRSSVLSQHQQTAFHRSVTQTPPPTRLQQIPPKTATLSGGIIPSPNIRGNGRTLLPSIIHKESTPKKNTGGWDIEMRPAHCPTSLAQEKQDVTSFSARGDCWQTGAPAAFENL